MRELLEQRTALIRDLKANANALGALYDELTLEEKVRMCMYDDISFLPRMSDGGFLYRAFPGGGWAKVLSENFHYQRHEQVELFDLLEVMREAHYDYEGEEPEVSDERIIQSICTSDLPNLQLIRAVIESGVSAFEMDW